MGTREAQDRTRMQPPERQDCDGRRVDSSSAVQRGEKGATWTRLARRSARYLSNNRINRAAQEITRPLVRCHPGKGTLHPTEPAR